MSLLKGNKAYRLFRCTVILYCLIALNPPAISMELKAPNPRITIIIDDLGDNLKLGKRAINLPGEVTCAILPHTPNAKALATLAHQQGKQIILHAPMQSQHSHYNSGKGVLLTTMDKERYLQTLTKALDSIPHLVGVNNHMGSLLTQQHQPMTWLMKELKKRKLFFIDSRTSADSVARQTALRYQIPSLTRDVFLDNNQSTKAIDYEFQKLLRVARKKGYAIGIGHPYPTTLEYLSTAIPKLENQGVNLIKASTMISGPPPGTYISFLKRHSKRQSASKANSTPPSRVEKSKYLKH